ncbi:MAG: amino acid transporter, partial [Myxococcota bacterium]
MAKGHKFGTFGGVFTPSVLTILGVIMYMRLPWIVGHAGLYMAIGIVLVAHVISITTGLSVASIATDKSVQAGGPYYIVSRSLGLPLGGTLGLGLAVGLSFSISLYIIGFTESLLSVLGRDVSLNEIRLWGTGTLVVLTGITLVSTALAIKTQYLILGAIAVSIVSIFLGESDSILYGVGALNATEPLLEPRTSDVPIATLFGIFFPAVTGFTAGVNMSGDLKDPRRAIPRGTLAAIAVGLVVYIALAIFLAYRVNADRLVDTPNALTQFALWPEAVIAGVWGATLSSALGSILGAPRILQALSLDRITPRIFGRGHGKSNEPRFALILCVIIAEAGILIGELNAIAAIVSMFFLATYGFLNMSCAIESWASADFRPDFKIPRWVSVLGAVACGFIMMQLGVLAMLAATVLLAAVFLWLKRRELSLESGDTWAGVWSSVVRTGLQHLDGSGENERDWRPNIVAFSTDDTHRSEVLRFGQALLGRRGIMTEFSLHLPGTPAPGPDENGHGIFHRVVESSQPGATIGQVCQHYGFSGVEPNTLLADYREHLDSGAISTLLDTASGRDMNVLLLAYHQTRGFGEYKRIDFWAGDTYGSVRQSLSLLRFMGASDDWHRAEARLLIITRRADQSESLHKRAQRLLTEARLDAVVKVLVLPTDQDIQTRIIRESGPSDLTLVGLPHQIDDTWFATSRTLIDGLGTTAFVRPSARLIEESATSTAAPKVSQAQDGPVLPTAVLTLPANAELARIAERFGSKQASIVQGFFDRALGVAYARDTAAVEAARQLVKRYFTQLDKALSSPSHPKQAKALARVQSAFLFQAHKLVTELAVGPVAAQLEALDDGIETAVAELDALLKAHAERMVMLPGRDAFRVTATDSGPLRRLKRTSIVTSAVTRNQPQYVLPVQALAHHYLKGRNATELRHALRHFGSHSHGLVVSLGKRLAGVRASLALVAANLGQDHVLETLHGERDAVLERLDALASEHGRHVILQHQSLTESSHTIAQAFADDLSRMDIVHLIRTQRRPARVPRLTAELAQTWHDNQLLVVGRAAMGVLIASFQQRIATIVRRTRNAQVLSLQNGVSKDYTRFADALRAFLDAPERDVSQLQLTISSRFDATTTLDDLT